MKQEEIDKIMRIVDKRCRLPKNWEEFIEKNSSTHHIFIKDKKTKELYCTHCNKTFNDTTVKVRDYIKCPYCNQEAIVYGANFYNKYFIDSVLLVQRYDKQIVIRVFEIYSYFEKEDKHIHKHWIEYARILPKIGKFIGNNVAIGWYGNMVVYHGYKKLNWYKYNGHRYFTDFPAYPYSKKRLVKGTNLEYAPIDEFLNRFSYYGLNYLDVLQLAVYESFELLWKMNLCELCFYSKRLNKKGNFQKRFCVPKDFLEFMQKNNVSYKDLILLQLFQKADKKILQEYRWTNINYLRFLFKKQIFYAFVNSGNSIEKDNIVILKEIEKYVPLKKLNNYSFGLKNLIIYRDYLKMSEKMGLHYKSKKDLFPTDLISRHDELQNKIKVANDMNTQFATFLRYLELSKYTYEDGKYIIFPVPSVDDLVEEGKKQGNCVATYLDRYIDKESDIYLIRDLTFPNNSLITLEFKNDHIAQKELPNHSREFTEEQLNFIDKWLGYRYFIDQKEKYKKKQEIKVIKYNFKNRAA